jgi:hypothetical protein
MLTHSHKLTTTHTDMSTHTNTTIHSNMNTNTHTHVNTSFNLEGSRKDQSEGCRPLKPQQAGPSIRSVTSPQSAVLEMLWSVCKITVLFLFMSRSNAKW